MDSRPAAGNVADRLFSVTLSIGIHLVLLLGAAAIFIEQLLPIAEARVIISFHKVTDCFTEPEPPREIAKRLGERLDQPPKTSPEDPILDLIRGSTNFGSDLDRRPEHRIDSANEPVFGSGVRTRPKKEQRSELLGTVKYGYELRRRGFCGATAT